MPRARIKSVVVKQNASWNLLYNRFCLSAAVFGINPCRFFLFTARTIQQLFCLRCSYKESNSLFEVVYKIIFFCYTHCGSC